MNRISRLAMQSQTLGQLLLLVALATLMGCQALLPARTPTGPIPLPESTSPEITAADLALHVRAMTDPRATGRRAGTPGERAAADYLARAFASIGLEPAGAGNRFEHPFEFTSGISLGPKNELLFTDAGEKNKRSLDLEQDWRPLAFSRSGRIEESEIVFAGFGLVAPAHAEDPAIDDYQGPEGELDVKDKWVFVFRGLPEPFEGDRRQFLLRHASLRHKAMIARDRGARGVLFVSGPRSTYRNKLIPLRFDASLAGTRIAVLSLSDEAAERLIRATSLSLEELQRIAESRVASSRAGEEQRADEALSSSAFGRLAGQIDLETLRSEGLNILGRLQLGEQPSAQTIVLGAHYDHLGLGQGSSSLAAHEEIGEVHPGADDNASGTALLVELAEYLAHQRRSGTDLGHRDFIFAAWSGEELGLLGSDAWVSENVNPHGKATGPAAYLNFDMVGRLTEELVIQGFGSSADWDALLMESAKGIDLSISKQQDSYVPTDATSFYTQGVPILSAFTGVHPEYHTPRDTADRLNLEGTAQIGELFAKIAQATSQRESPPHYQAQKRPAEGQSRGGFRVFLGTIPDYAQTDVVGVRLSGVAPKGPAERAGLTRGDVIVSLDGRTIENLYDYTYALEALRVDVPARLEVLRAGDRLEFRVVPASRD